VEERLLAELDKLLAAAEAPRRRAAIQRDWGLFWQRLIANSNAASGFLADMLERELGREPTPGEVGRRWAARFLGFGGLLVKAGVESWAEELPAGSEEETFVGELVRLACRPGADAEVARYLAKLHTLQQEHPEFYEQVKKTVLNAFRHL
jgi:hypothetical protein